MDPRDFCKLASKLATYQEKAALRSAVSRAYYSLFLSIHGRVESLHVPMPKKRAECHEKLYHILFNCKDDGLRKIATVLNDLRARRNDADYSMESQDVETPKTVQLLEMTADNAIREFDNICTDSARMAAAQSDMVAYAQLVQIR